MLIHTAVMYINSNVAVIIVFIFINIKHCTIPHKSSLSRKVGMVLLIISKKFIPFTLDYNTVHVISADQVQTKERECQLMQVYMFQ